MYLFIIFCEDPIGYPGTSLLGIIVSICNLGCFTGWLINMYLGGILGRKRSIWLGLVIIIVGAIIQTSYTVAQLMIGRFLTGMGTLRQVLHQYFKQKFVLLHTDSNWFLLNLCL